MDEAVLAGLKHGNVHHRPRHLRSIHIKEQHDGTYHVERHSGKMNETPIEHNEADLAGAQAAMEEHMGDPNEGEEAMGQGQPGMGGQNAAA